MALTIIFMVFFSIILMLRNYKNRYNLLFILMVFGMSISMFTIVTEIYRSSNYLVPSYSMYGGIENRMFLLFSQMLRLSLSNLLILRNLGIITYLIAIMLFVITFSKTVISKHQGTKPMRRMVRYVLLGAYPVVYFLFYHPDTAFLIFLTGHRIRTPLQHELWAEFIAALDLIMTLLAVLYLLYPIGLLIRNYFKNKISFFSEQLLGLTLSISLLNLIFFYVFFTGVFKTSVRDVFESAFWRYKLAIIVPWHYSSLMPILSFIILLFILFIMKKFKTDNMINGMKERAIRRNLSLLNSNLKDILHSDKNIMFSMKILAEEAVNGYGTEEGRLKLQKILTLSESHMNAISKTLDNIRELKVRTIKNNLIDSIEASTEEIALPEHIQLIRHYNDTCAYCNFDMYHMTQVITNLLSNAIDAINSHEVEDARIVITVDSSADWIYLSIRDNGCGIPRKLLRKIFHPYFSTKSKQKNWGIGLSYAFRVITLHYGHIRIKSRPGEFTNVEILLPRSGAG